MSVIELDRFSGARPPAAATRPDGRLRVAVVGGGVAGIGAAWLLARRHDVTLYEAESRVGGHSNTVDVPYDDGPMPVDTGFIVFNPKNYPNLVRWFDRLDVAREATRMSFGVSVRGGVEYGCLHRQGMVLPGALKRPSYLYMLADLVRFYRQAPALLARSDDDLYTLGEYLRDRNYGRPFVYDHLLPMGAAIWSCSIDRMLDFPARSFVSFFQNHGLLQFFDRPQWMTVSGGSRTYVQRALADFPGALKRGTPVAAVHRDPAGVTVRDQRGNLERFDYVVMAAHADQSLDMLDAPSAAEEGVLSAFTCERNRAILHKDPRLMPRDRRAWASWNYAADGGRDIGRRVAVTYWMNSLQNLPLERPVFVSLNPFEAPRDETVVAEFDYDHPQFDAGALRAQTALASIQGRNRTLYCGSYCGYGFHEDAFAAGLAAAEALGVRRPWAEEVPVPTPFPIAETGPAGGPFIPDRAAAAAGDD